MPSELEEQEILIRVADAACPSAYFQTAGPFTVEKGPVGILTPISDIPGTNSSRRRFLANGKPAHKLRHRQMHTLGG